MDVISPLKYGISLKQGFSKIAFIKLKVLVKLFKYLHQRRTISCRRRNQNNANPQVCKNCVITWIISSVLVSQRYSARQYAVFHAAEQNTPTIWKHLHRSLDKCVPDRNWYAIKCNGVTSLLNVTKKLHRYSYIRRDSLSPVANLSCRFARGKPPKFRIWGIWKLQWSDDHSPEN